LKSSVQIFEPVDNGQDWKDFPRFWVLEALWGFLSFLRLIQTFWDFVRLCETYQDFSRFFDFWTSAWSFSTFFWDQNMRRSLESQSIIKESCQDVLNFSLDTFFQLIIS
jgi:hypothetical protein